LVSTRRLLVKDLLGLVGGRCLLMLGTSAALLLAFAITMMGAT